MTDHEGGRRDLAAMMQPLVRNLIAAELPVLAAHGVSMWGYVVLNALDGEPMRTQAALAQAIGADKTRIIGTLDELQDAGLIERTPDPDDRRVRLLAITAEGRRVRRAVQAEIWANEDRLLAGVPEADRHAFLRVVRALSALPREEYVRTPGPAR
ncbi:MarR family winged helix-turn-helix transcriptional regulator [Nonomuraea sp. NPDC050536]|uniref:MarR family winged helix-turn-helix transcriptional regulator n=1 Tax=Nonomuraea sp. NPDC050536 TaxID=3364366 RepID=UPI0037C9CBF1